MDNEKTYREMRAALEEGETIWANDREGHWEKVDKVILVPKLEKKEGGDVQARAEHSRKWFKVFAWMNEPKAKRVSAEEAIRRYETYIRQQD